MGRKARFSKDDFINAAQDLLAKKGPSGVSISSIAQACKAPVGSVYHRFASRDILMVELWIKLIESFQKEFLVALNNDDGLNAALHTLNWVKRHPNKARVFILYRREELTTEKWPESINQRVQQLSQELTDGLHAFTRRLFGEVSEQSLTRVTFTLIDVPHSAVRKYLEAGKTIPAAYSDLVKETYFALLGNIQSGEKTDLP